MQLMVVWDNPTPATVCTGSESRNRLKCSNSVEILQNNREISDDNNLVENFKKWFNFIFKSRKNNPWWKIIKINHLLIQEQDHDAVQVQSK